MFNHMMSPTQAPVFTADGGNMADVSIAVSDGGSADGGCCEEVEEKEYIDEWEQMSDLDEQFLIEKDNRDKITNKLKQVNYGVIWYDKDGNILKTWKPSDPVYLKSESDIHTTQRWAKNGDQTPAGMDSYRVFSGGEIVYDSKDYSTNDNDIEIMSHPKGEPDKVSPVNFNALGLKKGKEALTETSELIDIAQALYDKADDKTQYKLFNKDELILDTEYPKSYKIGARLKLKQEDEKEKPGDEKRSFVYAFLYSDNVDHPFEEMQQIVKPFDVKDNNSIVSLINRVSGKSQLESQFKKFIDDNQKLQSLINAKLQTCVFIFEDGEEEPLYIFDKNAWMYENGKLRDGAPTVKYNPTTKKVSITLNNKDKDAEKQTDTNTNSSTDSESKEAENPTKETATATNASVNSESSEMAITRDQANGINNKYFNGRAGVDNVQNMVNDLLKGNIDYSTLPTSRAKP